MINLSFLYKLHHLQTSYLGVVNGSLIV